MCICQKKYDVPRMTTNHISIITVNFGSSSKLERLKNSLLNTKQKTKWEWIIVDNFLNTDEVKKVKKIAENHPNIHAITLSKNLGYGEGNAEGVRFATHQNLAIINPDIEIFDHTLDTLVETLKNEQKETICVPVLQTRDGQILENVRPFPQIIPLLKRRMFGTQILPTAPSKTQTVDWAQGSFWVLKKSTFEKLNGFDTRFFLFFEDTDFCQRLKKMGGQTLQIAKAKAYHDPNRLSGGNIFKALFRKTFWIHIHSAIKYFCKWGLK